MDRLKIYLDSCCYNRPFDDLTQLKIKNEAVAKMYIQSLIKFDSLDLYTSFMLSYEISKIPFEKNREHIIYFINEHSSFHVGEAKKSEVTPASIEIMETGIKYKDSIHMACSLFAECDYFITTDKRILKYETNKLRIVNPIEFVKIWREMEC